MMTGCAVVNNRGQNIRNGTNTRVGFIDSNNIDVTRALWNQIALTSFTCPSEQ